MIKNLVMIAPVLKLETGTFVWNICKVVKRDSRGGKICKSKTPNEAVMTRSNAVINIAKIRYQKIGVMAQSSVTNVCKYTGRWKVLRYSKVLIIGDQTNDWEEGVRIICGGRMRRGSLTPGKREKWLVLQKEKNKKLLWYQVKKRFII